MDVLVLMQHNELAGRGCVAAFPPADTGIRGRDIAQLVKTDGCSVFVQTHFLSFSVLPSRYPSCSSAFSSVPVTLNAH